MITDSIIVGPVLRRLVIGLALSVLVLVPARGTGLAGTGQGTIRALLDPTHPAWQERAPELLRVRFVTSEGEFVVELFRRWSPRGVDRLYNLVRLGYYDDTRVYRVRPGVFAQFGLSGDPEVNRAWHDETMADDPQHHRNRRGVVAYAMLGEPDTRTTQLFVNLRDNLDFDEQGFMPLGRVVDGMDVVDRFYGAYGESAGGGMRGGNQGQILTLGNAHLDEEFPRLSRIESARIEPGRVLRYPNVGANRIRTEVHMLPVVSSGPRDPDWSPASDRLVFAMRGDLWTVAAASGTAVGLTAGPGKYFEPRWSPDGRWIAFSRDLDGNLDVGVLPAAGGDPRMLTTDPHVDVQPAWAADSSAVYFSSARGGSFDVYRAVLPDEDGNGAEPALVVGGRGHQIQAAVSPDGRSLAFVSPLPGRLGTGALWRMDLDGAERVPESALQRASLVHYEETSYRAKPRWSANGRDLVFVSDEAGSNDIATVPAGGGSKARLTGESGDELDIAPSRDGSQLAFVSNHEGASRLYLAAPGGSRRWGWRPVSIERLEPAFASAQLSIRVLDEVTGAPTVARLHVVASDGRGYGPADSFERVISATELPYFHSAGTAVVQVPAGTVEVEARRGPEFEAAYARVQLEPGGISALDLTPERMIDMPAAGWVGGDTHSHDLHQGRFGLTHEAYYQQLVAEDLHVTNTLIHMDGTRLMGRWEDLTGEPSPLSTARHVLQYGQEFRGSFGHVGLLGISEFITPLVGGTYATAFAPDVLNADWLDAAHEQGGIGGYMHPYGSVVEEPEDAASSEIALDIALGKGDFYDVANYPYDDLANAAMYWRFLNAGFRLPASGGSDNFADVGRDAPPGSARTYAYTGGTIEVPAWLGAVSAGRTFATNGPLLRATLRPAGDPGAGYGPGEVLELDGAGPSQLEVRVDVASAAPLDHLRIVVNGEEAHRIDVRGRSRTFSVQRLVDVPASGWVAVLAVGPAARAVTDGYPFAHTTPVYVVRDGRPFRDPAAAEFLAAVVRAQWQRVEQRDGFADEAARQHYHEAVQAALAVYAEIAAGEASR